MKNLANTQNVESIQNLINPQSEFYYLIKTIVRKYSGEQSEIITMFNKSVLWEEACIGIRKGLMHQLDVECCDIHIYTVRNNVPKLWDKYDRYYLAEPRKEYLQSLMLKAV